MGGLGGGMDGGMGWGWDGGVSGNIREISEKFPEIYRKFPEILRDGRNIHFDIVKRQIKNFSIGLQKNNSEIMPDPPVEYLRNVNFMPIIRFCPTGLIYEGCMEDPLAQDKVI